MADPKKILVVDDEPLVCETVKMFLEFDGHKVSTAASGNEALDLFGRERFDLVVTDYTMPGMNGADLARAIKARQPGQPVVMLTAHAEMLKSSAVPLTGVDEMVSKPFQLEELRAAIEKAVAR